MLWGLGQGLPWLLGAQPGGTEAAPGHTQGRGQGSRSRHPPGLGSCLPSLGTGQLWEGQSLQSQHGPRPANSRVPSPAPESTHTVPAALPPPSVPGHMVPLPLRPTISRFWEETQDTQAGPVLQVTLCGDGDPSTGPGAPSREAAVPPGNPSHPDIRALPTPEGWRAARSPPARAQSRASLRAEACQPPGRAHTLCTGARQGRALQPLSPGLCLWQDGCSASPVHRPRPAGRFGPRLPQGLGV